MYGIGEDLIQAAGRAVVQMNQAGRFHLENGEFYNWQF